MKTSSGESHQAIAVEKAGLTVDFRASRELELPQELTQIFENDRNLAKAFQALTPGRQRAYALHFTGAKQTKTCIARIERCVPKILAGKGISDRYLPRRRSRGVHWVMGIDFVWSFG